MDCVTYVDAVEAKVETYQAMVSSLTRCLNKLLASGNPLMSYGYRNLDSTSQQYYSYLLNWRRPGMIRDFSASDEQLLSYYAQMGFFPTPARQGASRYTTR
jgi:hypothetical protein